MTPKHFIIILAGLLFITVGVFARSVEIRSDYEKYSYAVFPPLVKDRDIVINATKNSPKKIKIEWLKPDGSSLFSREFNVIPGEKLIISPINE
jgi:hypothetical protein